MNASNVWMCECNACEWQGPLDLTRGNEQRCPSCSSLDVEPLAQTERAPAPPKRRGPTEAEVAAAMPTARLLVGVYWQVSHRYRTVARLPEGLTGRQALARAVAVELRDSVAEYRNDRIAWAFQLDERGAGEQYLRCYAPPEAELKLDVATWAAYRRAGGGVYDGGGTRSVQVAP